MTRKPRIEIRSRGHNHWWCLVAANNQTLAHSETYDSRRNAIRAARRVQAVVAAAVVVEVQR